MGNEISYKGPSELQLRGRGQLARVRGAGHGELGGLQKGVHESGRPTPSETCLDVLVGRGRKGPVLGAVKSC